MTEIETGVFFDPSKQYLHEQSGELQALPFALATWEEVDAMNSRQLSREYTNTFGTHKLTITFSYVNALPSAGWSALASNPTISLQEL